MRSDLKADVAAMERSLARSPRAWKLHSIVQNVLNETNDHRKRLDLESLLFSLGLYIDSSQDVSEAGELNIMHRLEKITGRVYCEACEAGDELFGAGDVLPLFHQRMVDGEPQWFDCPRSVAERAKVAR